MKALLISALPRHPADVTTRVACYDAIQQAPRVRRVQ
jgi:hypothetical protein